MKAKQAKSRRLDRPETWPCVWRVLAPRAGSYDHDMIYLETEDETKARQCHGDLRRGGHPVRLERVACGPLPVGARANLAKLRSANAQTPGTQLRAIAGAWEAAP